MKLHRIYYAGMLYDEVETWRSGELPDGAYVHSKEGLWYLLRWSSASPINLSDVPKGLRALELILS